MTLFLSLQPGPLKPRISVGEDSSMLGGRTKESCAPCAILCSTSIKPVIHACAQYDARSEGEAAERPTAMRGRQCDTCMQGRQV